jgi:acyl-CoA synthetase (NDP forming)
MKEETLVKVSGELETCGKALLKLAEALRAKEETLAPEPQKNEPGSTKLTLEEVRKAAADKSRQGFTAEVKALIEKYGAEKLSSVKPEDYEAFMKELEEISHAG